MESRPSRVEARPRPPAVRAELGRRRAPMPRPEEDRVEKLRVCWPRKRVRPRRASLGADPGSGGREAPRVERAEGASVAA